MIDYTVGGILEKYVAEDPDHEFMIYPDRGLRFTYKEFDERVNIFAKGLLSIGVTKGSKVGVWAKNVPDWMTFMFATAKIGAVLVTVNTNYKNAELEYIMKNADIHTMCMVNGYRDSDYVQILYDLVPELKTTQRGKLRSEKFPELRNVVYIGQEKLRGMYNTSELMKLGTLVGDDELERAKSRVDCHDEINMQYTSGTTGFPKGVMLTSHNILNNGLTIGDRMHFTAADRLLICVPLFHCFGCVLGVCSVITHGSTMVMVEDFDPLKVLASVHRERCTALHGVPTMFIAELHHPMFDMFDLSSLRTGIMAGAPCPIETMKQVMDKMYCKEIISVYGLTETSPGMTASATTDSMEIRATTVGRAFPNVEVKVLDPQTNEECPPGTPGEMCCKGYNIMKGYYKNPEATAAIIDENGFLHSGDLGVMDENGYFRITGRIKEMIIRGGENIYPREIENFLYKMPQIEAIEVAGIPSPKYGEQVGAFIKIKEGCTLTEEEVKLYCRGQIARYKIPKYIFFVEGYPMTASGKIQKYRLKDIGLDLLKEKGIDVV
ncbi:AMP-binding protein [Alistipes sp. dk3620]|uniref:AMP-binding protein n=1 Tax=Alistipes hominis TaxID=2763015 RepID=A0ABR7CR34_9BACT|nr:AMP-binding protein [Alistipes hominis]MBS1415399.1 AMP-binding protein [Alistipes sp.]MQX26580.1 AMP-binding protein [Alistipes sp. dk3620]QGA24767.1 AMP-binding protein [Alistipes sp. dk3624]RHR67883.1 AMP-binding protein [Alistipes sp. AF17-16]